MFVKLTLRYLCYATNSSAVYQPQTKKLTFNAYPKAYTAVEKQQCALLDNTKMTVEVKIGTVKFTVNNVLFVFKQAISLLLTSEDLTGIENFNLAVYNLIFTTQKVQVLNLVGIYDYMLSDRHECYQDGLYSFSLLPGKEFFSIDTSYNGCNLEAGTATYKEIINSGVLLNASVDNRPILTASDQKMEWICNQTLATQPVCIEMNKNMSGSQVLSIEVRIKNLITVKYQGLNHQFNQTISYMTHSLAYDLPNDCYTAGTLQTDGLTFILKMTKGKMLKCDASYFSQFMTFDESAIRIVIQNSAQTINVKVSDTMQDEVVMSCADLKIDCKQLFGKENNIVISYLKFITKIPLFKESLKATLELQEIILVDLTVQDNQTCITNAQLQGTYHNYKVTGEASIEFTSSNGCYVFSPQMGQTFNIFIDNQLAHYTLYDVSTKQRTLWFLIPSVGIFVVGSIVLTFWK